MNSNLLSSIVKDGEITNSKEAGRYLQQQLDTELCIGELLSINYHDAQILVHDYNREKVRGLPHGSFLVASRMNPDNKEDILAENEETCLILLRIIGDCPLPNAREMEEFRFQAGMRATDSGNTWDHPSRVDDWTRNNLSYGGYKCRVLGTFRMNDDNYGHFKFTFGADLVNFYSGKGMKVYKPIGVLLNQIVNFQKTTGTNDLGNTDRLRLGRVRFSASEIGVDENSANVPVKIDPIDFVSRRTFYGGMSRGGKSNAMKITAKAVYLLRKKNPKVRVGQLIFDPNGEYANDNVQDRTSIKSVYTLLDNPCKQNEISTYGLSEHPNDPDRKIVKINFFGNKVSDWKNREKVKDDLDQLIVGKTIIDSQLQSDSRSYIKSYRDTTIDIPLSLEDFSEQVRFRRFVEVYRSTLFAAGFRSNNLPYIKGLFSKDLLKSMKQNEVQDPIAKNQIESAADTLAQVSPSWDSFVEACKGLFKFMVDKKSGYDEFDRSYRNKKDGRSWDDGSLRNLLAIYEYPNGIKTYRNLVHQHSQNATKDFAQEVVDDLRSGKLVLFDQSTGDPEQNVNAAERILWAIFNRQKLDFINPEIDGQDIKPPPPIMVYLEEAHNLLPAAGGKDELKTIWARTAKEGSKYRIGLVLATQEPSSVMPAILKNTDNWFIAHLNNSDEVRSIAKFYDFEDYSHQIKSITDPGFVRMRTLSNPFTIPVQIDLFSVKE